MCSVMGGSGGIKDLAALQCHGRADYIASNVNVVHPKRIHDPFFYSLNCVFSILFLLTKPYKSSFGMKNS